MARLNFQRTVNQFPTRANLNNRPAFFGLILCLLPFFLTTSNPAAAMDQNQVSINCDIHKTTCVQHLSNNKVTLEAGPRPVKAMRDLTFRVTLQRELPTLKEAPYILLDMPGMKMGVNRVDLKATDHGVYQGDGIIVRCPSGIKIWRATVIIPGLGEAQFVFDVIY